ncbi:MAG: penicillin-binding protein 1C, partial [Pseudomonadota bacterium]|nr:penicillin-binding protein 1C [Pseudomonadota bacterium]
MQRAEAPLRIAFPPDGARVDLGAAARTGAVAQTGAIRPSAPDPLALKATGGAPPFTWLVNGAPVSVPLRRRDAFWIPDGPGFARLTVIDSKGQTDAVTVRLE